MCFKLIFFFFFSLISTSVLKAQNIQADSLAELKSDKKSTWTIESDFNYKYVWHAIEFQNALTINPSVNFQNKGFYVNGWFNIPMYFYDMKLKDEQDFKEFDLNIGYEFDNEFSFTSLAHSAQIFTPLEGECYWGILSAYQGFYLGSFGIYVNPEYLYYPFDNGLFLETGFNFNHETEKSSIDINFAYGNSNKSFTEYIICEGNENSFEKNFSHLKLDSGFKFNLKKYYIRPHFTWFYIFNF